MKKMLTRRGMIAGSAGAAAAASILRTPTARAGAVSTTGLGGEDARAAVSGRLREYWIAASPFSHCLVPTGRDAMTGTPIDRKRATVTALQYRAYTPGWRAPLAPSRALGPNGGMPGPTFRAEVGDVLRVHFRNDDHHYGMNHGMHPHGVFYRPHSDGAEIAADPGRGGAVKPGETYTYEWHVRPDSVGTWPYHDHAMSMPLPGLPTPPDGGGMSRGPHMEIGAELGLFGIIAITDARTPKVDRELILFFHDMYSADLPPFDRDWDCFNGYAYLGNTPTFRARVGERVRWRIAALGTEFHVFHAHGHRWRAPDGSFVDSQLLGPSTTLTVEWVEDNPGTWLYHCHVVDHMMGGMIGHYVVS